MRRERRLVADYLLLATVPLAATGALIALGRYFDSRRRLDLAVPLLWAAAAAGAVAGSVSVTLLGCVSAVLAKGATTERAGRLG